VLLECCTAYGLMQGLIITAEPAEELEVDGVKVTVLPLYRWLLM